MQEGRPSDTAMLVAILRAYHLLSAPEPKILRDEIAIKFTDVNAPEDIAHHVDGLIAGFAQVSDPEIAQKFVSRIEESVNMRSRLVDEQLRAGASAGLRQLVVLGAGLDSTAYRFAPDLPDIEFFEVDFPATQQWKRSRLESANIELPERLQFIATDFESKSLDSALREGGVRFDVPTLFSWLGVQPYLADDAIVATLNVLGQFAKGSELVMDFIQPDDDIDGGDDIDGIKQLENIVAQMREPFKSRYSLQQIERRLRSAGFSSVHFYTTRELIDEFLAGERGMATMEDDAVYLLSAKI